MPPTSTYFAGDGNYGEADDLVIVNTNDWSEEDWNEIEEAADYLRVDIAKTINERIRYGY
jgi:hypothetical protein